MTTEFKRDDRPVFDQTLAESLVGKYMLIGISYYDVDGNETDRKQIHGIVEAADRDSGVTIRLKGKKEGQLWKMPADLRSLRSAAPGTYRLYSTGEKVHNPDLISTWVFREAVPEGNE